MFSQFATALPIFLFVSGLFGTICANDIAKLLFNVVTLNVGETSDEPGGSFLEFWTERMTEKEKLNFVQKLVDKLVSEGLITNSNQELLTKFLSEQIKEHKKELTKEEQEEKTEKEKSAIKIIADFQNSLVLDATLNTNKTRFAFHFTCNNISDNIDEMVNCYCDMISKNKDLKKAVAKKLVSKFPDYIHDDNHPILLQQLRNLCKYDKCMEITLRETFGENKSTQTFINEMYIVKDNFERMKNDKLNKAVKAINRNPFTIFVLQECNKHVYNEIVLKAKWHYVVSCSNYTNITCIPYQFVHVWSSSYGEDDKIINGNNPDTTGLEEVQILKLVTKPILLISFIFALFGMQKTFINNVGGILLCNPHLSSKSVKSASNTKTPYKNYECQIQKLLKYMLSICGFLDFAIVAGDLNGAGSSSGISWLITLVTSIKMRLATVQLGKLLALVSNTTDYIFPFGFMGRFSVLLMNYRVCTVDGESIKKIGSLPHVDHPYDHFMVTATYFCIPWMSLLMLVGYFVGKLYG